MIEGPFCLFQTVSEGAFCEVEASEVIKTSSQKMSVFSERPVRSKHVR
jgi:hypothetical protein